MDLNTLYSSDPLTASQEATASRLNNTAMYHGGPVEGLTPEMLSSGRMNAGSLVGPGAYLASVPDVSGQYASLKAGPNGTPAVYKAALNLKRVLDADAPASEDVLNSMVNAISDNPGKVLESLPDGANFHQAYHAALTDLAKSGGYEGRIQGMAAAESRVRDFFAGLKQSGIDAIRYNVKNGRLSHEVVSVLDPNHEFLQAGHGLDPNISSFEQIDRAGQAAGVAGPLSGLIKSLAKPLAGAMIPPFLSDIIQEGKQADDLAAFRAHGT